MAAEEHLEWGVLAGELRARLVSGAARERLRTAERLLVRHGDLTRVRHAFAHLDGLQTLLAAERLRSQAPASASERISVGAELANVLDVVPLVRRAFRASVLELDELAAVADVTHAADRIGTLVRWAATELPAGITGDPTSSAGLDALLRVLEPLRSPLPLSEVLARSLERGEDVRLSDRASEALGKLRQRAVDSRQALVQAAEHQLRKPGMERALADRYWTEREGRLVLPVRSDAFSRAGGAGTIGGLIHGSSQSGQTLYVEPHALIDLGNARREAVVAVQAEEHRIRIRLSRQVGEAADILETFVDALVELDSIRARLRLSDDLEGVAPRVVEPAADGGVVLRLPAARHPLMVLRDHDVVPNDLVVPLSTGLVVSGPNAGGKTVALKTVGLCVLMTQAGLRLPTAMGAEVPLFRQVVTDVGDDQSIAANLSTFSAHIGHVRQAVEAATEDGLGTLVLLDEVAVGTEPEQGAALAEAILLELVQRGATLVVTTHYERLKLLATSYPASFTNAAVGFDLARLKPTFTVTVGAPGSSSALAVARRLGLPDGLLRRAESLLSDARVRIDDLLREVEAERERLRVEAATLAAQREQLEREQAALVARQDKDEQSAAVVRRRAHAAAASQLRTLEDEIKARRKAMRKAGLPPLDDSGVSDPQARAFSRQSRGALEQLREVTPARTDTAVQARVGRGDRVRIESLGVEGEVLEVRGAKLIVQLPLAKTTVARTDVRRIGGPKPAPREARARRPTASEAGRHFGAEARPATLRFDNVVDVRGVRADEAVTMIEVFFDRAIAEDVEVVFVRHGHGSGALRKAVREHLPRLRHVAAHRPGLSAEGGDAVTVVWVRT